MRKLSRTRLRGDKGALDRVDRDNRPPGIPGATVTSRPHIALDLSNILLRQPAGTSVTSSEAHGAETLRPPEGKPAAKDTVSLSDGTRITFATID
jgi:hypothetical protein